MKLSILICTLPERQNMLVNILANLERQYPETGCETVLDDSINDSIGKKRNRLLQKAKGDYVCFIDDDDEVSVDYIKLLMEGINKGVDCCSLKGIYMVDGRFDGIFNHSLKYNEWKTNENPPLDTVKFERYPNHLNCIKASIAKQFKFPEKNFGEDHDWSKQLHESGLLKTEHYIEQPIYFYKYISKK